MPLKYGCLWRIGTETDSTDDVVQGKECRFRKTLDCRETFDQQTQTTNLWTESFLKAAPASNGGMRLGGGGPWYTMNAS